MRSRRKFGSFEVKARTVARHRRDAGPTVDASKAAFEMAGIGPEDVDVAQLQDTESGAEIMHMAENGFCEHGEQEGMLEQRRHGDHRAACRSTRMAGVLPTVSQLARPACGRFTRTCCSCAAMPASVRCPTTREVAYTHVYGAPGISGVNILSR